MILLAIVLYCNLLDYGGRAGKLQLQARGSVLTFQQFQIFRMVFFTGNFLLVPVFSSHRYNKKMNGSW